MLGHREHGTRFGVPWILQVMNGMDGALARKDREEQDQHQDKRPRPA
jgi:hypothetical protein